MIKLKLIPTFLLLLFLGCVTTKVAPDAAELAVYFSWEGIEKCSGYSPEIKVSGIPAGTKFFEVKLKDLDAPQWDHGGGKAENNGSGIILAGALKNRYNGPCPPRGSHRYQFTVNAVNGEGIIIGIGKAVKEFP